jgi:hypothetical protein
MDLILREKPQGLLAALGEQQMVGFIDQTSLDLPQKSDLIVYKQDRPFLIHHFLLLSILPLPLRPCAPRESGEA